MLDPKSIAEFVLSQENRKRIEQDYERYLIWNGNLKDIIFMNVKREFALPETVEQMEHRITPLNIVQRITQKLAQVYRQKPIRQPIDENPNDQQLIDLISKEWEIDRKMKFADSMFELSKQFLIEPFVNTYGCPKLRVLASHTYSVMSDDPIDPTEPTIVIKHLTIDMHDPTKNRYAVWTKDQHYIINNKGEIQLKEMNEMNNPQAINPYTILPFTYVKKSEDRLIPIPDDDLISIGGKIIPILLTDLNFASKYQAWSLIALIGAESEKLSFNPNSVISLPEGARIETVKPQIDIDAMLRQIQAQLGMLLSSKGLKVGNSEGTLNVENASSGVAKMIDNAESQEIREDRLEFFKCAEESMWYNFAHYLHPIWTKSGLLDPEFGGAFSKDFELSIRYPEMKVIMNEQERVANAKAKLDAGFITKRMAIQEIDSDLSDDQVEQIIDDMKAETLENVEFVNRNMVEQEDEDGSDIES